MSLAAVARAEFEPVPSGLSDLRSPVAIGDAKPGGDRLSDARLAHKAPMIEISERDFL
jgi:hypothetical protein